MTTSPTISGLTPEELRNAVVARYGRVATHPDDDFNFPVGRSFAEAIGYPPDILDRLPPESGRSFAGVAYLPGWVEAQPEDTVVDLGCGAGLDSLIVAGRLAGDGGEVIGLDYSEEMAARARENARAAGIENMRVLHASAEEIPLPDASVDMVIANGIFNLSPEKDRVIHEIARILKPGGNMTAAEIVLTEDIPASERSSLDDWFR